MLPKDDERARSSDLHVELLLEPLSKTLYGIHTDTSLSRYAD